MPALERDLVLGRAGSLPTVRVLLIEDDDDDAKSVEALLQDDEELFEIVRARTLAEGMDLVFQEVDCAVLDLDLPDADGPDALRRLLTVAGDVPVVVLTGTIDRHVGKEAVAAGAQDYLVKANVTAEALGHAVRYAMERGAALQAGRQSFVAERRQLENEHLARGLLPRPLLQSTGVEIVTRYRPRGPEALLGGDFVDAIECADGSLRLLVGDVCGHGPDEAAIGVALRISWRALVLAGLPAPAVLAGLEAVFAEEQSGDVLFATVCDVEVTPDKRTARIHLCGHPAPMLVEPEPRWLDGPPPRPPIGLAPGDPFEPTDVALPPGWALLLLTDGLFEGRAPDGERLGMDRLLSTVQAHPSAALDPGEFLDGLIDDVRSAHGGDLPDDVALLWVDTRPRAR